MNKLIFKDYEYVCWIDKCKSLEIYVTKFFKVNNQIYTKLNIQDQTYNLTKKKKKLIFI